MYRMRFRRATQPLTRLRVRTALLWRAVLVGGCAALLGYGCHVRAGTETFLWVPSASPSSNRVGDDLELGLRARKLLQQDGTVAGQMLGVSIHNRIATLWGTVPSASAARLAEACLRNLPGLAAIRNELHVNADAGPEGKQAKTAHNRERSADGRPAPGVLVHRTEESALKASIPYVWRPAGSKRPAALPSKSPSQVVERPKTLDKPCPDCLPGFPAPDFRRMLSPSLEARQPRSRADATTLVMPAITLPLALPTGTSARAEPSTSPYTASNLGQAIEALRITDERFYQVRVEIRGETVYLSGTVYSWEHLFELARSISRLAGVRQVLFGDVRAESSSSTH
jgi:hypothetical protein